MDLSCCMRTMIEEEARHYNMFRDLNRRCLPSAYDRGDRHFTRLSRKDALLLRAATILPKRLDSFLWLIIAMEEYSVALSRAMMEMEGGGPLGKLEHNFVQVHREHVKDEARHVHLDVHLIHASLSTLTKTGRIIHAWFFRKILMEILPPKRGSHAVLQHFLKEFPELEPRRSELLGSLRKLRFDGDYLATLFNRNIMPQTFALFDELPELARLGEILPSYQVPHG